MEKTRYIYNIYNNEDERKKERKKERESQRVLRSCVVPYSLWESAKEFASYLPHLHSVSRLVAVSLSEYMTVHASELPLEAKFTLVLLPDKPTLCGFKGCRQRAVEEAVYKPTNQPLPLCQQHLTYARSNLDNWSFKK